jgi:hypothetical protein
MFSLQVIRCCFGCCESVVCFDNNWLGHGGFAADQQPVHAVCCAMLYCTMVCLSQLPADAVNLLRKMLELNPAKRIRAIDALFVSTASLHTTC